METNREKLDKVQLRERLNPVFDNNHNQYLKQLLQEVIVNALGVFKDEEKKGKPLKDERKKVKNYMEYSHWIDNQIHVALFKELFRGHLQVR